MHVNEPYYEPVEWQANTHGERFDVLERQSPDALELTINRLTGKDDGNPGPTQPAQHMFINRIAGHDSGNPDPTQSCPGNFYNQCLGREGGNPGPTRADQDDLINQIAGADNGNPGPSPPTQDGPAHEDRDPQAKSNLQVQEGVTQGEDHPPHSSTFKENAPPPLMTLDLDQGNQHHQEEEGGQKTLSDQANKPPTPIIINSRVDSRVTDDGGGEDLKGQERKGTPPPKREVATPHLPSNETDMNSCLGLGKGATDV